MTLRDVLENVLPVIEGYITAKTLEAFDRQLWSAALSLYRAGDVGGFIDRVTVSIREQLTRAWNEGARDMGVAPQEMTAADLYILETIILSEYDHILDLAQAIEDARAGTLDEFRRQFRPRIDLWVNRYTETVNTARIHFGGKTRLVWRLGATEEHCETCAALNGIVAFATEWEAAGIQPQTPPNPVLECGGWRCDCTLEPTTQRRSPLALNRLTEIAVRKRL